MRRFHADREGVTPSPHVLSLWRCDESDAETTLNDSSYGGLNDLVLKGAAPVSFVGLLFGVPEAAVVLTFTEEYETADGW